MQSPNAKRALRRMAVGIIGGLIWVVLCPALSPPSLAAIGDGKALRRADRALRDGEYEVAEKMFRELLAKDAHDNSARLGLSFALLKQRLLQDAYDHAARVVLADPLSSRAHALLGAVILGAGDFRNSVEEFRTALIIQENESLAVAGLGMVDFYENPAGSGAKGFGRRD